jgi:hypothetical protein
MSDPGKKYFGRRRHGRGKKIAHEAELAQIDPYFVAFMIAMAQDSLPSPIEGGQSSKLVRWSFYAKLR